MVIVNNDIQAVLKKKKPFMPVDERIEIIKELKCVDYVIKSIDIDRTVCKTIEILDPKPTFFCNGGDQNNLVIPEKEICIKNNIELRDGFGEKIQSSSWLISDSKINNQNKIFIIGFNKSGTRSLHNFFDKNNIPSIHWDEGKIALNIEKNIKNNNLIMSDYKKYTVFSDIEYYQDLNYSHMKHFKIMNEQYPSSKFILNIRNIDNWIESRNNHMDGKYCNDLCEIKKMSKLELNTQWKKDYLSHINNVKEYFKNTNKLLVFDIENDKIEKLISFFPEYKLDSSFYEHCGKTLC